MERHCANRALTRLREIRLTPPLGAEQTQSALLASARVCDKGEFLTFDSSGGDNTGNTPERNNMDKNHKLTTVNEIIQAVNEENLNCFIEDFKNFLAFRIAIRNVGKAQEKDFDIEMQPFFDWTDDGTNNITITTKIV